MECFYYPKIYKMTIQQKLQEIFRLVFNDSNLEINDEMTANDVAGWTSLTHLIMIERVEAELKIKLTLKELIKLKKVGGEGVSRCYFDNPPFSSLAWIFTFSFKIKDNCLLNIYEAS